MIGEYKRIYDEEDSRNYEEFDEDDLELDEFLDEEIDETYEDIYDPDGDLVYCDYCNNLIKMKDGQYICIGCGQIMDLNTFLNYIGIEPNNT